MQDDGYRCLACGLDRVPCRCDVRAAGFTLLWIFAALVAAILVGLAVAL